MRRSTVLILPLQLEFHAVRFANVNVPLISKKMFSKWLIYK
jgi:hypothetical protein